MAAAAIAAAVAVFAIWLPSVHARQDRKWQSAGQRAISQIAPPASFHVYNGVGKRIQICGASCWVGSSDPQQNVPAWEAAMASVASGPAHATCHQVPIPNSPATCVVLVPVTGSKLELDLFARAFPKGRPVSEWTYNGTYAELHLASR